MRALGFALVLLLSACQGAAATVYNAPLPGRHDTRALARIGGQLKPEDREAWTSIKARILNPAEAPFQSKTVGEAITRWKTQRACLQKHAAGQEMANTDQVRDHEIDAYNDCLEMQL